MPISERAKITLLSKRRRLAASAAALASHNSSLATAFLAMSSREFRSEAQGTLKGQALYWNGDHDLSQLARLRRNTHRLEKGLTATPRRLPFAERFIEQTIELRLLLPARLLDPPTQSWVDTTLAQYFAAHPNGLSDTVDESRERWTREAGSMNVDSSIETERLEPSRLSRVSEDQFDSLRSAFDEVVRLRQSVRSFAQKPVPTSAIQKAMRTARFAPSACNRDATRVIVVQEEPLLSKAVRLPWGTSTYADNVPCFAFVIGDLATYEGPHDRHALYVDGALFAMTFVLALTSQGIATCFSNWPDRADANRQAADLLRLAPTERVVTTLSIGFPSHEALVPNSRRSLLRSKAEFMGGPSDG